MTTEKALLVGGKKMKMDFIFFFFGICLKLFLDVFICPVWNTKFQTVQEKATTNIYDF